MANFTINSLSKVPAKDTDNFIKSDENGVLSAVSFGSLKNDMFPVINTASGITVTVAQQGLNVTKFWMKKCGKIVRLSGDITIDWNTFSKDTLNKLGTYKLLTISDPSGVIPNDEFHTIAGLGWKPVHLYIDNLRGNPGMYAWNFLQDVDTSLTRIQFEFIIITD